MGTPLQTYKHEAPSPLGCLCYSPLSFCWQPGAPGWQTWRQACSYRWQTWRQAWSCCWQTWRQTCCSQTCSATRWTSKQRKIVDMHLDSRTENLDPGHNPVTLIISCNITFKPTT